jgi:FkbM family methyltransferase
MSWKWYQNPKTQHWYRTRTDDWLLSNRIGQDGGRGYQVQLQDWVREYFRNRPAQRVIDVGANMGITAIEYAGIFESVEAFEPIADVYKQLQMVIERNGITNVSTHPVALSDHPGTAQMSYRPNNSFASAVNARGGETIQTATLDSYQFQSVDFIKIDVEGLETAVIDGGWNTIEQQRPLIQFEYKKKLAQRYGYDIDTDICERLQSIGYHIEDKKGLPYQESKQSDLFAIAREEA